MDTTVQHETLRQNKKKPLPLGEVSMPCIDGEGKLVIKESPYSDEQGLSQREHIAALYAHGQRPCPLSPRCAMPLPGLRLPESASLSLASCWPLPQQLLPASAAGGGRRRCSQRESRWQVGSLSADRRKFNMAQKIVPCYRGQQLRDNIPCQAAVNFRSRALLFPIKSNSTRPAWA